MRQEMIGFWDRGGISWTICKQSAPRTRHNHTNTPSLNFYRPDAHPDAQPTVSKYWRQIKWIRILTMVQLGCSAVATVVVVTAMARAMYRAAVQQSICIQSDHSLGNLKFPDISLDSSGTPIHVLLPTSCIYFLTVLPVQYKHTHTQV